jgi:hypothetical protein
MFEKFFCENIRRMSMKLNTLIALAFATTAILSNTPSLAAEKVTTYNGGICQPTFGTALSTVLYSPSGITNTSSSSTVSITCPAMVTDGFINNGARVWVYWTNGSKQQQLLYCTFFSLKSGGQIKTSTSSCAIGTGWLLPPATPDCTTRNGTPGVTPSFVIGAGYDDASYALTCSLPPNSQLNAIQVNEIL